MSSISSFDTESVESDLHDSESIKSKTPDSIDPFDSDSSSVSGQSELDNSPTERRNAAQERKAAPPIDTQRSGGRGLSKALLERVRKFRTFILQNPQYKKETRKWSSKSEPYSRRKDLDVLAAYYYDEDKQGIYRQSEPIEGEGVSSSDFDAASLFKEWSIIQRALNTAQKNNLFSPELESPDADSVEEESSDDGSSRSSTSPEPVTPDVMNQHSRQLQKKMPSKSQSIYAGEWKEVSKLIKAQNKQLRENRQDMESLTEIVKSLEAKAQQTGSTPTTRVGTTKRSLFQPTKHSPTRKQFAQPSQHRSLQTPRLGTEYPRATAGHHSSDEQTPTAASQTLTDMRVSTPREWQPVPAAQSGGARHTDSVVKPQYQPCLPVDLQQEQEIHPINYNDHVLTARRDILNFKISDLGVFDPRKKPCLDRKHQTCWGRDYNIFSDVHSWIQSVDDNWSRIDSCELDIVTRNLWTLLEGPAIVWWRSQLTQNDREQLQASKEKMLQAVEKEFRLDISDAIGILETSKFDRHDIMGEASIQTFAYKIFRAAKACGGTSNEHLLTRLYLSLDPDLQVFVDAPKSTDILSEYVQMLNEKIKAYRRRANTEEAVKVHFVGGTRHSEEGGSCVESLYSTGNGIRATEGRNGRSLQNVNKRKELYPNNWPYERHYQNGPHFLQRNVPRFQRVVAHPYRHDRRRDLGEDLTGQQVHDRGGRNEYYDYEFGTNDLEDHWDPYRAAHKTEEHTPYGLNHQRMEFNHSGHENQDQSFQGKYYGQQEQNAYQPNESLNRWPPNEGLRNDYHPRLLGPPEDEGNGH
ncbi:retrotransposable element [Fusarium mundagurra]|uniref:Retrotransposable element n=1 Tax=Fusarium mundagurra TaxID=1567541 RepID=A0A8H5XM21_9HYPO|nr:retrotransposable element [Fusarium mundagurra]